MSFTAEVHEIARTGDPVRRNLRITQCYHDLSAAMEDLFALPPGSGDGAPDNATWSTFGCWASKTAGGFIRGDELPREISGNVAASIGRRADTLHSVMRRFDGRAPASVDLAARSPIDVLIEQVEKAAHDVSLYVAEANKRVFEEIGGAFARFVDAMRQDPARGEQQLAEVLTHYREGKPEADEVRLDRATGTLICRRRGGQGLLREMLRRYFSAMQEADPRPRAQLVTLGNSLGAVHEQTRVQPYIVGSLDTPLDDLVRDAVHAWIWSRVPASFRERLLRRLALVLLSPLIHGLAREVHALWQHFATEELMKMRLPDTVLHLGRDVRPPPGQPLFPPELDPIELRELQHLLGHYGALDPGTSPVSGGGWFCRSLERIIHLLTPSRADARPGRGSAAHDWASLRQRMRYILVYFRSYQLDQSLFEDPFSSAQRAALADGRVPEGRL